MLRFVFVFAALFWIRFSTSAAEWQDLQAQYQNCTVIGGLGFLNGDLNPNEWNDAEGAPALQAELSEPHMAMADINGRIFVADKNAHAIRRIDLDGTIHTVAGMNLDEISGGVTNAGYNGDGPARQCLLNGPQNAYVLPDGTFYILDSANMRIRRVDSAGIMTTVITDMVPLNRGLWVRRDEQEIYYCTFTQLKRWTPSLGNAPGIVVAGGFSETGNIDLDASGNIYVSDRMLNAVYRVPPAYGGGAFTDSLRVAGLGGGSTVDSGSFSNGMAATQIGLLGVRGVAFHPLGGYFVATHKGGDVWYIDPGGKAWMFVEGDSRNAHVPGSVPVPATGYSVMSEPRSVTVSLSGDVIIACNDAGYIRIIRNVLPPVPAPVWERHALMPAGMQLRWQSAVNQWYFLEHATALDADAWLPLATLPSAGALTEFTDAGAVTGQRAFYRLRALRAWPN